MYQKILTDLRIKIQSDAYDKENMSLSENVLAKRYSISRMTARRIMQELAYEGLISRKQGRAMVLNPSRKTVDFLMFESMAEQARKRDQTLTGIVHRSGLAGTVHKSDLWDSLASLPQTEWFYVQRSRLIDEVPAIIDNIWLIAAQVPEIATYDLSTCSIKQTLAEVYNIRLARVSQLIETAPATANHAALLNIAENFPLIKVYRVVYDQQNSLAMVALCYFRSDIYRFHVEIRL